MGVLERVALAHIEFFKYPLNVSGLVYKHSFKEVFELQPQTKLSLAQVFHLKLRLEVSHRFLNVPCSPNDVQIIDIDGDYAKSIIGFLYENTGTIIIIDVTSLQEKVT